jgi:ABC-type Fe3+-hydroxamate transport system substrate-binding protein
VAGIGTFIDDLVREAGGENIAADTGLPYPRLSLEAVLARAPEVIIDTAMRHEEGADPALWTRFPSLPAVRDGRVYGYRAFTALRGGPRLAEAAEEFARMIHPELSPRPEQPARPPTAPAAGAAGSR